MIEFAVEEETTTGTGGISLKVMGIGGAGGNAVNSMIEASDLSNVQFIAANTDAQALNNSSADHKIQLGKKITKGLGAGSNPDVGRQAAEEDLNSILDYLANTDILFLTAGLGGGTGSGALPVIARAAKELGILTIAVVTKPFLFEGKRRQKHAEEALNNLEGAVDTLLVVPNQRLIEISDPNISMLGAFALANDILRQAIKGISDIITKAGHINVDLADVRTIMTNTGIAIMGTGRATGIDRARQAAVRAISSPLIENASINGARGVLINITGASNLELQEINQAASMIYEMASQEAIIILGSVIDETMGEDISITVIATGLDRAALAQTISIIPAATAAVPTVTQPALSEPEALPVVQEAVTDASLQATQTSQQNDYAEQAQSLSDAASQTIEPPSLTPDESFDMDSFDTPTFMRKKATESEAGNDEVQEL
ncbi:MAG: cell division protein FtsZ [Candidatus Babeliales bacterium]|jgi:cell division protein FtsZ